MMLDANLVAVSPASVWRVLHKAGHWSSWNRKPSRKGTGFRQPPQPHPHWPVDGSYLNIHGTFYYLCSLLDGFSRYIVDWEIGESMPEAQIEILIQRAREKFPDAHPRILSDNGPQFIARDFKEFIRICGMTHTPGRRGQFWRKLKSPMATLDVVVTAVEYGHGKRRGLLSDYTFSVRAADRLVTIGKAYSGLTDAEIQRLTDFFQQRTLEDHGFRRSVEPVIVLEVPFNNIQRSSRHESGYALRFPRIVRLRPDKVVSEIDTLERVQELYERQLADGSESGESPRRRPR